MDKFEELLVAKGLYDSVNFSFEDYSTLTNLFSDFCDFTIDCFCVECEEKRIFKSTHKYERSNSANPVIPVIDKIHMQPTKEELLMRYKNNQYNLSFACTRNFRHVLYFNLLTTNDKIIKIGQYPSFADVSISNEYKPVLKKQYVEYKKAIGLIANGIGIGSFVYLRRIIENLVYNKYKEVSDKIQTDEATFKSSRFQDKIDFLREYLPKILVDNANVYGIISKGIHELSEEECITIFPKILVGIEAILDEIIFEKKRMEKEKQFTKDVANITGEIK